MRRGQSRHFDSSAMPFRYAHGAICLPMDFDICVGISGHMQEHEKFLVMDGANNTVIHSHHV